MEDYEHPPFASLDQYLHTSYHPDVDFVDGALQDRLFGEWPHSVVRSELILILSRLRQAHMRVLPSIRIRVSPTCIRVADIALLAPGAARTPIVGEPPVLCVEVLEPQDNLQRVTERCRDFELMGVAQVWMIDPTTRKVFMMCEGFWVEHTGEALDLTRGEIRIDLRKLFAVLDE